VHLLQVALDRFGQLLRLISGKEIATQQFLWKEDSFVMFPLNSNKNIVRTKIISVEHHMYIYIHREMEPKRKSTPWWTCFVLVTCKIYNELSILKLGSFVEVDSSLWDQCLFSFVNNLHATPITSTCNRSIISLRSRRASWWWCVTHQHQHATTLPPTTS